MLQQILLNIDFLITVLNSSKRNYSRLISAATSDQLRSIALCVVINCKSFKIKKCTKLVKCSQSVDRCSQSDVRAILLKSEKTVRLVLALILSKVVFQAVQNVLKQSED